MRALVVGIAETGVAVTQRLRREGLDVTIVDDAPAATSAYEARRRRVADAGATVTEYRFEPAPDGKGTLLRFTQTSKDKAPLLVESLQKGALRETYATQVRAVNRALGLAKPEEKRAEG